MTAERVARRPFADTHRYPAIVDEDMDTLLGQIPDEHRADVGQRARAALAAAGAAAEAEAAYRAALAKRDETMRALYEAVRAAAGDAVGPAPMARAAGVSKSVFRSVTRHLRDRAEGGA